MSDVSSAARGPDGTPGAGEPTGPLTAPAYPSTQADPADTAPVYPSTQADPAGTLPSYPSTQAYPSASSYPADTVAEAPPGGSRTGQAAGQAKEAAAEVKETAKEQAHRVAGETRAQARNVASELRGKASEQARSQNDRLVGTLRQTADQLDEMRADRDGSPAATVVSRVADGGRQLADYLDRNGPEGVLREVQDFARRRPGAFLATALAAGFVVGRLGKGVARAEPDAGDSGKPDSDAYVSQTGYSEPGYTAATEYASTGTGTPVVVAEDTVLQRPERRP